MPKKFLISYTGKMPVEVDLEAAILAGQKKAKKDKRSFAFDRLAVDRSGTLTLRRNSTTILSGSELEAVKESLGDLQFKRFVVEHGEYKNPRSERPKEEVKPKPKEEESGPSKTEPRTERPAPTVTTVKGSGKKKVKG